MPFASCTGDEIHFKSYVEIISRVWVWLLLNVITVFSKSRWMKITIVNSCIFLKMDLMTDLIATCKSGLKSWNLFLERMRVHWTQVTFKKKTEAKGFYIKHCFIIDIHSLALAQTKWKVYGSLNKMTWTMYFRGVILFFVNMNQNYFCKKKHFVLLTFIYIYKTTICLHKILPHGRFLLRH